MGVEPFVTEGVDIESHLLDLDHLAAVNGEVKRAELEALLTAATDDVMEKLTEKYVNGKIDVARKSGNYKPVNAGKLANEAHREVRSNATRWHHGKTVHGVLRARYQTQIGRNLISQVPSTHLRNETLATVAHKVFGSKEPAEAGG